MFNYKRAKQQHMQTNIIWMEVFCKQSKIVNDDSIPPTHTHTCVNGVQLKRSPWFNDLLCSHCSAGHSSFL